MLVLIDVIAWAVAIIVFAFGIFGLVGMFIETNGWIKFVGVIAAILGVVAFWRVYVWMESVGFSLFATGFVWGIFGFGADSEPHKKENTPQQVEQPYGITDAVLDTYCEYELTKEAAKAAIRELKE